MRWPITYRSNILHILWMFAALACVLAAPSAHACTSPAGNAGDIIYDDDRNLMLYCDANNWIAIRSTGGAGPVPTSGLVGHWTLDETSGSTIRDYSPSGNNGTWSDAVNNDVTEESTVGQVNNAITFDNSIDHINLGNPAELQITGGLTISAWARPASSHDGHIVAKWDWPNENNASYRLQTDTVSGSDIDYEFRVYSGSCGAATSARSGEVTVTTNEWHHIVGVYEPSSAVQLYIDGILASEETTGIPASLANCASDVLIGTNSGATLQEWEGDLDDIRVYNRALTSTEISTLYQNTGGDDTSLALHLKLDETSGTVSADSSVYGNDGTLNNFSVPAWSSNGTLDGALLFDGTDDVIVVPDANSLDINNAITVAAWINTTCSPDFADSNRECRILQKGSGTTDSSSYALDIDDDTVGYEALHFCVNYGGIDDPQCIYTNSGTVVNDGTWHHVAASWDGTELSLYVDGQLDNTASYSAGSVVANSDPVTIGGRNDGNGDDYSGLMDDVRIYTRALSANEIASMAAACSKGSMIYNADHHVPQYCAGSDDWVAMGPVRGGIDNGLVGHWQLDETSGTTAGDASGNLLNGSMIGGLDAGTDSVDGKVSTSLLFDGVADGIQVSNSASLENFTSLTLSAWVYPTAVGQSNGSRVISKSDGGNGDNYLLGYGNADQAWMRIETDGDVQQNLNSSTTLPLNQWTHIVGTWDGQNMRLYENGVEVSTSPQAKSGVLDADGTALTIGTHATTPTDRRFPGRIDDARVYNRALSRAEVIALYKLGNDQDSALVGHWKLDELSGTNANDVSLSGIDGTLNNFDTPPAWSSSGTVDGGLVFDGTDDGINLGDNFDMTGSFTICAWAKPRNATTGYIFGKYDANTSSGLFLRAGSTTVTGDSWTIGTNSADFIEIEDLDTDVWQHVCGVVRPSPGTSALYKNASVIGTSTSFAAHSDNTVNAFIGNRYDFNRTFDGSLDDVRVYNKALSTTEIDALYKLGIGHCTGPVGKEGDMIMNDLDAGAAVDNALIYCDGANWQAVGKTPP